MVIHFFHALIHKKPINESEFFGIIITFITNCRGKDFKSCNRLWAPPGTISKVQGEEMVAKGISNLALIGKGQLEDNPRRNVFSDVMNIAQTCTLAIRRTPPPQ